MEEQHHWREAHRANMRSTARMYGKPYEEPVVPPLFRAVVWETHENFPEIRHFLRVEDHEGGFSPGEMVSKRGDDYHRAYYFDNENTALHFRLRFG